VLPVVEATGILVVDAKIIAAVKIVTTVARLAMFSGDILRLLCILVFTTFRRENKK
jgi:hypothetical protein